MKTEIRKAIELAMYDPKKGLASNWVFYILKEKGLMDAYNYKNRLLIDNIFNPIKIELTDKLDEVYQNLLENNKDITTDILYNSIKTEKDIDFKILSHQDIRKKHILKLISNYKAKKEIERKKQWVIDNQDTINKFKSDFKTLLEKYGASIEFECEGGVDDENIYNEGINIYLEGIKIFNAPEWEIDESDF